MQKSLWALAALGLAGNAAFAQSSVTVFGILDVGARYLKNGSLSIKQLSNNGYSANQLGFRGIEDLGGGLQAGFWLEAAHSPDVGTSSATTDLSKFWSRRATVSLISATLGELRLGRDLDPSYRNLGAFDAFGNLGVGSNLNLISTLGSGATTLVRSDNAISYFLPSTLGGVYGQFTAAAGEGVPGVKYKAGRIGYAAGPLNIGAGIGTTGTATSTDYKIANAGVSYNFGPAIAMLFYNQAKYGNLKQTVMGVGATAPVGQWEFRASAQRVNASGRTTTNVSTDANDAKLFAIGATYALSKRTTIYGTASQISNDGLSGLAVGTTNPLIPAIAAAAIGRKSTGYEAGIRHAF